MFDWVWPIGPGEAGRLRRLGTVNGFGSAIMGRTRVDEHGYCFGTRWLVLLWLPVLPLGRYYLTGSGRRGSVAGYRVAGRARLRGSEIVRTYLFCWLLVPGVVGGPELWMLTRPGSPTLVRLGCGVAWLAGSVVLIDLLLRTYRARWAPPRRAHWTSPERGRPRGHR